MGIKVPLFSHKKAHPTTGSETFFFLMCKKCIKTKFTSRWFYERDDFFLFQFVKLVCLALKLPKCQKLFGVGI